ncbi:TetR/AcrR family transcriptional regulator [Camelimonas abortus]|uniref:TetR/AcrR family transcriptional regulator n=1 Tax=Camelimonas abortus TaxID=1017184 RepID=A0ABV7LGT0_9HYPH
MAPKSGQTADDDAGLSALSGHAAGKMERRNRILAAAEDLVRLHGVEGVPVEAIARRAGVSPATVYNLFGSRGAIFSELFDADLARFEALVASRREAGPVGLFFEAIDVAVSLYAAEPAYYRALLGLTRRDGALYARFSQPRLAFWRRLVAEAHAAGALRPGMDPGFAGDTLASVARGALDFWADGRASLAELRRRLAWGFGVVLLSLATENEQAEIRRRMAAAGDGGA